MATSRRYLILTFYNTPLTKFVNAGNKKCRRLGARRRRMGWGSGGIQAVWHRAAGIVVNWRKAMILAAAS